MHLLCRKVGWSAISLCRSSFVALQDQRASEFFMRCGNRLSYPHCHPTVIFWIFFVHIASSPYTIWYTLLLWIKWWNQCAKLQWLCALELKLCFTRGTVRHGHTSQIACKENHFSVVYNCTRSLEQIIFLYMKQTDWCGLRMKGLMELTKSTEYSLFYLLSVQPHISVDFISRCYVFHYFINSSFHRVVYNFSFSARVELLLFFSNASFNSNT